MKNASKLLIAAAALLAVFLVGRCSGKGGDPPATEPVTVRDTVWRDIVIPAGPIPAPTPEKKTVRVYVPTGDPAKDAALAKLQQELAYYAGIVAEKERVIAALESAGAVGGAVGVGEIPAGPVEEKQTVQVYEFYEMDSLTGIRINATIGCVGLLSENPPPVFGLIYPERFTTTTHPPQVVDNTKRRALGLSLAMRRGWQGKGSYEAGARLHYRRAGLLLGTGLWASPGGMSTPVAAEVSAGVELGWRGKK